jgi:hypothetical protein
MVKTAIKDQITPSPQEASSFAASPLLAIRYNITMLNIYIYNGRGSFDTSVKLIVLHQIWSVRSNLI